MLSALAGIWESFSTIGRAIVYVINGIIETIGLVIQATTFLYGFMDYVPVPLQIISAAIISVSAIYLVIGRQH